MTIWIDVDDLIGYFYGGNRPSGIQRLSYDLASALIEAGDGRVRACRHGPGPSGFTELDWEESRASLHEAMQEGDEAPATAAPPPEFAATPEVSTLRRAARGLPLDLRGPLAAIYIAERNAAAGLRHVAVAQLHALRALRDLLANAWRWLRPRRGPPSLRTTQPQNAPPQPAAAPSVADRPVVFAPGDVLISTGATWQFAGYAAKIAKVRAMGVRFAPFAHDMVPLLFPEWSVKATTEAFERWARGVLAQADILFSNSDATAADVAFYARREGLPIPKAIKLPIGATFPRHAAADVARLCPRPYVLLVSTIEPRKNHAGMLRLWRRLLVELPESAVPDLVFAGRVGWLAHDVVAQAENADWFGGRLRLIEGPSDAELAALYRDCLFTLYPSFYEGWGLPVTESLSFGKPVAASNRASIPEAGGEFCVYFDPENLNEAYEVVSRLIREPELVAALEREIAARFRPPSWHDSARAILTTLDAAPFNAPAAALSSRTG